ncbi:DrmB family protein [Nostoc sp.]
MPNAQCPILNSQFPKMSQSNYKYRVGELRPSQILFSFGVGAVLDLPNLSVMVMGLEDWNTQQGVVELGEQRLLAAIRRELGQQVKKLLAPPIPAEDASSSSPFDEYARIGIPVAPFPGWMVCPRCRLLAPLYPYFQLKENSYRPDQTRYVHLNCPKSQKKDPTAIPSRFLVSCERGHLDDFPWLYFVHRSNTACKGPLRLEEYGVSGSPTDIVVKCNGCNSERRLSDAFGELGKKNMPRCRARHPHLRGFDDSCDEQMKTILLGASNSWFPITLSALSIPITSNQLEQLVNQNWTILGKASNFSALDAVLQAFFAMGQLQELSKYTTDKIWALVEQKQLQQQSNFDDESVRDLKTPEWQIFSAADPNLNTPDFQLRTVNPPSGYKNYFSQVVLVERLREVRALIGFTRIQSPGDFIDSGEILTEHRVPLSRSKPKWVPASEVKGEGIFIQFKETTLHQWEQNQLLQDYERQAFDAHKKWCNVRSLDPDKVKFPGVRYILLHSFAHALMRQMALECGYNAASLKERIYSKRPEEEGGPMAGILIYTAAPDSEGTLGGLVSLGEPKILGYHIDQALEQMRLCASDPLCAEHTPFKGATSLHWAACHACLFSPETSCERGNKYLDRAVLIPTVLSADLAFFPEEKT